MCPHRPRRSPSPPPFARAAGAAPPCRARPAAAPEAQRQPPRRPPARRLSCRCRRLSCRRCCHRLPTNAVSTSAESDAREPRARCASYSVKEHVCRGDGRRTCPAAPRAARAAAATTTAAPPHQFPRPRAPRSRGGARGAACRRTPARLCGLPRRLPRGAAQSGARRARKHHLPPSETKQLRAHPSRSVLRMASGLPRRCQVCHPYTESGVRRAGGSPGHVFRAAARALLTSASGPVSEDSLIMDGWDAGTTNAVKRIPLLTAKVRSGRGGISRCCCHATSWRRACALRRSSGWRPAGIAVTCL